MRPRPHRGKSGPRRAGSDDPGAPLQLFGLHSVRAALDNPRRVKLALLATPNALRRLAETGPLPAIETSETSPRHLDRLLGPDAVHQGVALKVEPLARKHLAELDEARLLVVLDQVTDPHNVGAILRTACAFGADALITTARHAPRETAVLAKSASGALDMMDFIEVKNLADAIGEIKALGFVCLGFDSEAGEPMPAAWMADRLALVLGAEGKGLRDRTRSLCDRIVRLSMPGPIKSLNVSNAAAIALYAATAAPRSG